MNKVIPVIIIGAGISGIAASSVLSKNRIQHVVLESRDRIGGRIFSTKFNGDRIQLGASFVHHPKQSNCVAQLLDSLSWPKIPVQFQRTQSLFEEVGQFKDFVFSNNQNHHQQLIKSIKQQALKSPKDISIAEAASKYMNSLNVSRLQKMSINWMLQMYSCIEGAQLHEISAKQYNFCESLDDYFPVGGYDGLIEAIVKKNSPQILMNQRVTEINYEQSITNIKTASGEIYQCERVISSLPLGVLKKNVVKFMPELPDQYKIAIDTIGNGRADKLFVTFAEPFWDEKKKWINFYTQKKSPFPSALAIITKNQNILSFYISGDSNKTLGELSKQDLIKQLYEFFAIFKFEKEVRIKDVYLTAWHKDPHSLGSYSYSKVGTERKHFSALRQSIHKKLWFIGEHCNEVQNACVHSAYQTGVSAAKQISEIYHSK